MVSLTTLARYVVSRMEYSLSVSLKSHRLGIKEVDVMKNFFQGKLTFLHWNKGQEMAPTIGPLGGTLLVRKIPFPDSRRVSVGDVVVLKDPANSDNFLVRRLAATEGYEMVSTEEKDEPFVLENDQCWVLADNENIKPKQEAYDSRMFGPVSMSNIVGRVIYCLRNAVDHGPVSNRLAVSFNKLNPIYHASAHSPIISSVCAARGSVNLACRRIPQYWKLNWMLMTW